jgi:hypothetical protein
VVRRRTDAPLAHYATNIVIDKDGVGTVLVTSKGLGVGYGGRVGSVTYHDVVQLTTDGWHIASRRAQIRRPEGYPLRTEAVVQSAEQLAGAA